MRLLRRHAPADLHAASGDLAADHGSRDHLPLALLEEQDGHALAHVFARDLLEDARARPIEIDVDRRLAGQVIEAGLRVIDAIAGEHHLLAHQDRESTALHVELVAEWNLPGLRRL